MAQLAIQIGVAVGTSVAGSLLAPKPKLNPVDKGRAGDIRVQTAGEGEFIPLVFGRRARLAGNIFWGTRTKEYVTRTPGRSGGKGGGGRAATPPTNNYTYKKSFAVLVCGNRIRRYRRITEDLEDIFNGDGSDSFDEYYEAELAALSGSAAVAVGPAYSGGRAVSTGTLGTISFKRVRTTRQGAHTLTVFYKEAAGTSVTVSANAVLQSVALPATGGAVGHVSCTVQLDAGVDNAIDLLHVGLSSTVIDRIHVTASGDVDLRPVPTGVLDPDVAYPADIDDARPFYNYFPAHDGAGTATGSVGYVGGGQAQFEFYTGTEDQLQSPTIVAVEGAGRTPAYRDDSYVVFKDYLLKEGRLGNFIFEVEPYHQDLEEIMLELYRWDGRAADAELDFSALAGTVVEGLVIDRREQLAPTIDALQLWYGFDVVPVDGKITAVPRGGAVTATITADDLAARLEGAETPAGPVAVTHNDPLDAPGSVDVLYLDPKPSKDFHTGSQTARHQVGTEFDPETLSFPIVGDDATAHAVGLRYLDQKRLELKPAKFQTGPKWRHLMPTDVVRLELPNVTRTLRITGKEAQLQGLVRFRAVPERAAIYSQPGTIHQSPGVEHLIVAYPANTFAVVADLPALRQQDVNRLVLYAGGCPRGEGSWRGFHLNKRDRNDEWERLAGFQLPATLGVVETASNSTVTSGLDSAREFVVKLYYGSLESRTEAQIVAERVNLAVYGKGNRWEVLQFTSVTPEAASAPYVAQYRIKGTLTGLLGTEGAAATHEADDLFLLVDEAVQPVEMRLDELTLSRTFVAQTVGQALADAEVVSTQSLTFNGNSLKPLPPASFTATRDAGNNTLLEFEPRARFGADLHGARQAITGEEQMKFELRLTDAAGNPLDRPPLAIFPLMAQGALLVSDKASKFSGISSDGATLTGGAAGTSAASLQQIRETGNSVEAGLSSTFGINFGGRATLGLVYAERDWRTAAPSDFLYAAQFEATAASTYELRFYVKGVLKKTLTGVADGSRVRIVLAGREARFHVNYRALGDEALYREAAESPAFPLRAVARVEGRLFGGGYEGTAAVRKMMLTTQPHPKTIYTNEQRIADYGDPTAAAHGKLAQISALVGRGQELGVTF